MFIEKRRQLCLFVVLALLFVLFTAESVNGKTKYKSYYVPVTIKKVNSESSYKYNYKYYKTGLLKSIRQHYHNVYYSDQYETLTIKRNKYGFVKKDIRNTGSDPIFITVWKSKRGKPVKATLYNDWGDGDYMSKEDIGHIEKIYYKKGKLYKIVEDGGNYITTTYYSKKGRLKKTIDEYNAGTEDWEKVVHTYKYKFNKKGDAIKITEKEKQKELVEGKIKTTYYKTVTKNKFYYSKNGKLPRKCVKVVFSNNKKYKSVITYKFKKVKVAKKYWKLFKNYGLGRLAKINTSKTIWDANI